jgi:2-polyprenyl-3-methyl-5-hydroxy-6-metoxy-1,4-benzoquinol methylase
MVEAAVQPGTLIEARVPYRACPLCEGRELRFFGEADCTPHPLYDPRLPTRIRWLECRACKHSFTDGYFTDEARGILLSRSNEHQRVGFDIENQRLIWGPVVSRIAHFVKSGNWLDVGFGDGSLMLTAGEFGYRVSGIDLRMENVRAIAELGYEAECIEIDKVAPEKRFAVVSMTDVLEHMPFPKDGLAAAHRLLSPGGVLFLSMPNAEAAAFRILTRRRVNPYWAELEHYHNFTRSRLYSLLDETGFDPVEYNLSTRYRLSMEVIALRR